MFRLLYLVCRKLVGLGPWSDPIWHHHQSATQTQTHVQFCIHICDSSDIKRHSESRYQCSGDVRLRQWGHCVQSS
jgi:hypothetical protein